MSVNPSELFHDSAYAQFDNGGTSRDTSLNSFPVELRKNGKSEAEQKNRSPKILVVEDNDLIREMVYLILQTTRDNKGKDLEISVKDVDNVEEGLEALKTAKESKSPFDAVILDLGIFLERVKDNGALLRRTHDEGGYQFALKVKQEPEIYGNPRIVLHTANEKSVGAKLKTDEDFLKAGIHEVLIKGEYNNEKMQEQVLKAVDSRQLQ